MAERLITTEILQAEADAIKSRRPTIAHVAFHEGIGFTSDINAIQAGPLNPTIRFASDSSINVYHYNDITTGDLPKDIESITFNSCPNLHLHSSVFENNSTINTIKFVGNYDVKIDDRCFANSSLTTLSGLNNIVWIGDNVFDDSAVTTTFSSLPKNITHIGNRGMVNKFTPSTNNYVIPGSVKYIGDYAFASGLSSLRAVWIRSGCEHMGACVFASRIFFTEIYCEDDEKPSGWNDGWNNRNVLGQSKYTVHWGQKTNPFT